MMLKWNKCKHAKLAGKITGGQIITQCSRNCQKTFEQLCVGYNFFLYIIICIRIILKHVKVKLCTIIFGVEIKLQLYLYYHLRCRKLISHVFINNLYVHLVRKTGYIFRIGWETCWDCGGFGNIFDISTRVFSTEK